MPTKHMITAADILPMSEYLKVRTEKRRAIIAAKPFRQVPIGPYAMVTFENYDSMWLQIQEMLYIEKGGAEQLVDELAAYNPMIPKGDELTTTLMFEIDEPGLRKKILAELGRVEYSCFIRFGAEKITAIPEDDTDRTNEEGKTSSVHFLHFRFSRAEQEKFRQADSIEIGFDHPKYGHIARISPAARDVLATDFGGIAPPR
ncbi:MAG: DUF3501 family protein [Candidatus Symbiobacter sp.]|nr:DUF3501 family protein [Candidatus Symbiobacter sp.]